MPLIDVNATIPGGRIAVISADDPGDIRLSLPADPGGDFRSWFYFRVTGAPGVERRFHFTDAGLSLRARLANREGYPNQWQGGGPVASYDGEDWFRLPSSFDGLCYSFSHVPEHSLCYYAKWAPYPDARERAMVAAAQTSPLVGIETIGHSVDGRAIDMLTIGTPAPEKKKFWIIARQHACETQGGFFVEGMVERLLESGDGAVEALLDRAVLHVVPNVNPDGAARGLTRQNVSGANLNREWMAEHPEPEIACVRDRMEGTGLDFFLDCHADAELECNFTWPSENVPSWTPARRADYEMFARAWEKASPDYVMDVPYPGGCPEVANLEMGWNWVGERFPAALSVLLEQSFKDVTVNPEPRTGWSPQRAKTLGRSVVDAMSAFAAA